MAEYTVRQLAHMAGVSVRTLHYYDEIALLVPTAIGANGYRRYGPDAALRLQQILFLRELDFSLAEIQAMLNRPGFDQVAALRQQREALAARVGRLHRLIETIDQTIEHLEEKTEMATDDLFAGFDPAKQAEWEKEVEAQYGDTLLKESQRNWARYSKSEREAILREGQAIYSELVPFVGGDPAAPPVQAILARWHQHMRHFYEPPLEVLRGHGHMYADHPDFAALYRAMHPDMPEFLRRAITVYVDALEAKG